LHTDAVQAFGRTPLRIDDWHVSALSLSAHKFNGPKGVGVLVLRRTVPATPVLHGGGQERGVRSGTFNAPAIVGCGAAAELTMSDADHEVARLRTLRDTLIDGLCALDGVTLNGSATARLPHNVHLAVAGCDGEALMAALDAGGVCASAGSACQSGAAAPSHVLAAIDAATDSAHIRLTCGRTTTSDDVGRAIPIMHDAITQLRDRGGGFL
jgi:cysteine desulfurase